MRRFSLKYAVEELVQMHEDGLISDEELDNWFFFICSIIHYGEW